ncbi:MAG: ABC transporter [Candidatus Aramenus sulfurataquae]|uniref:ATP-binding cassette domain-containing protein n=5 Tax=Candidatus Aramenus sulfurataquae TaxID=1326980 RepID=A0ACC6TRD4_9CREN|nr:MAG: ABC transporter [Candidatus Aramenus sulfurataquae]
MYAVEIKGLSFSYLGSSKPSITVDELYIEEGESVLVVGKSGSGKSTLVNCINGVIPHMISGELRGEVVVMGNKVKETPMSKLSTVVGTVLQDPESQVVNYLVEEEVAFGPENLGLPPEEVKERVSEALRIAGIEHLAKRETTNLSGGELQRTVLASVLAMRPKVLILDEPTSNIDPEGTNSVFATLRELKGKKTMIVVEHKVERVLPFVDRVILIDKGRIALDLRKEEIIEGVETLVEAGVEVPSYFVLSRKLKLPRPDFEAVKKGIKEGKIALETPKRKEIADPPIMSASIKVTAKDRELVDASIEVKRGELVALMGRNGAGKTTLLKAIAGLTGDELKVTGSIVFEGEELIRRPIWYRGKYFIYLPQSFDLILVTTKVEDEIAFSLKKRGVKGFKQVVERYLREFGLEEYRKQDPMLLSMGQRRRVAMASVLASGVKVLFMDEPTSGQDFYNRMTLGKELRELTDKGYSIVVVTHDSRFAYEFADRIVVMSEGKVVANGKPEDVFKVSHKYGVEPPSDFLLRW